MKTKLVLWGHNEKDEKILIALQLRSADNKVDIWTFPDTVATDDFARALMNEWRNDKEVPFPDEKQYLERELSVTDSLLPENIKVDRGDIVQRAQTEWHFVVLSSKLNDLYRSELSDLKEKVTQLNAYRADIWEELKGFWSKVQGQVKDRNLLREHADILRDDTNKLFDKMKKLRTALDDEFRQMSQGHVDKFMSKLEAIENNISEGTRLPAIFDELKGMQRSFREIKLTREHRSKIWNRLDAAFKAVKERRFGPSVNSESSAMERLTRRFNGLIGAIDKMKKSIDRDEDELKFQQKRIDNTDGQLEAQIRQAKINMTQERIRSKGEKYQEMLKTREDLERRIGIQKDKDAKRKEKQEREAAKVAAKEKIAKQIQAQAEARKEEEGKLEKAAGAITNPKKGSDTKVATEAVDSVQVETPVVAENLTTTVDKVEEVTESVQAESSTTIEGGQEVVENAKEVVGDKVEDIKENATGGLKTVGGAILGAGAAALTSLKGAKDAAVDKVADAVESVGDTTETDTAIATTETISEATEKAASATETVSEAVAPVTEKVEGVVEAAKEKAASATETVSEAVAPVTEKVEGVVEAAKEKAASATETVSEAVAPVTEKVEGVVEAAKDKVASATETVSEAVAPVTEKVEGVVEATKDKVEDIKENVTGGLKAAGGAILGAGAAALASLKGAKDAVADKVSDLKESVEETAEKTPDAITALETGVTNSESNKEEETTTEVAGDETLIDKASDVMEDVAEGLSATFKAGAAAIFGAGAAAASVLSGDNKEEGTAEAAGNEQEAQDDSAMDKITDVVEDITEAATSTLKTAAGALFGLGTAAATKLSGEEQKEIVEQITEQTTITTTSDKESGSLIDDIAAVSEIVEDKTDEVS